MKNLFISKLGHIFIISLFTMSIKLIYMIWSIFIFLLEEKINLLLILDPRLVEELKLIYS